MQHAFVTALGVVVAIAATGITFAVALLLEIGKTLGKKLPRLFFATRS